MKSFLSILFGLIGAALVIWLGYMGITGALSLVPPGEYAGLIKLAVVGCLIFWFGVLAVLISVFGAVVCAFAGTLVGEMLETGWRKLEYAFAFKYGIKVGARYRYTSSSRIQDGNSFVITKIHPDGMLTADNDKTQWNNKTETFHTRWLRTQIRAGIVERVKA